MALTRISSAGIQTSPTFSGDVRIGLGATLESTGNAYITGITTLGIGATGEVYLYNPANSAASGTENSVYGWKAKTYCLGLQVNSCVNISRSGINGLGLGYNNATGSYITANSGFLNIQVPHGPPMRFYASCFEFHHNHGSRQSAFFNTNGAIQLNHNGNKKFETTNEGICITGIATVTGSLSVGGTVTYEDVSNVDSIGIITAQSGIHVDDSIVHIGDLNTKIRFPANDTITAETGGTERLRIDSSGDVGIGTDNPLAPLHIYDTSDTTLRLESADNGAVYHSLFRDNAGTKTRIGYMGFGGTGATLNISNEVPNGSIFFSTTPSGSSAGAEETAFRIHPDKKAEAYGDLQIPDTIVHTSDSDTKIRFPDSNEISFETGGVQRLKIHSDGKMSFGHDNPSAYYDFEGPSTSGSLHLADFVNPGQNTLELNMYGGSTDLVQFAAINSEQNISIVTENAGSVSATTSKGIYIKSGGNVGVNNVNPAFKLDVAGTFNVTGGATISGVTTTTSFGLTTEDLFATGITTVFKSFRVEGREADTDGLMPFVVRHGGYQGIQTSLFTATLNNSPELVLQNEWGGNWNTTQPWKLKWTSPNESDAGPAGDGRTLAELMPAVDIAGSNTGFRLRATDGSTGLKNVFLFHPQNSRFYINNSSGTTEALAINAVGVGITQYIYHAGNAPSDINTRFGFSGNDTINFETNGTERLLINNSGASVTGNFGASGNISLSGSFIMPDSLLHANDTTTRIRFPGPGTFSVDTYGVERLRITSTGRVGIGTTNPIAQLDVNVGSSVTAFNIEGSEGQLFSVTNNLSSGSIFAVNDITGLPSVDVNADGTIQLAPRGAGELVGIGTTAPTSKLHVVGDTLTTGVSTVRSKIHVKPLTAQSACVSVGVNNNVNLIYTNADQSFLKSSAHYLSVANNRVFIQRGDLNCSMACFIAGAQNSFTWNYVQRLSTSSIGATVFGQLDTTDLNVSGVTTASNLNSGSLTVTSSNAIVNLTTTQSSFTRKGEINHFHNNGSTAHNKITLAPRNGSVGRIIFSNMVGGTLTERLRLDGNDGIQPSTHIVPMTDSTYNLGSDGTRFANIYADTHYGCGGIGSRLFQQDSAKNLIAGTNAGLAITVTTSPQPQANILIGQCAGSRINTSCLTVAIGQNAGACITGGSGQNTLIGSSAGQRAGCCGHDAPGNTFLGMQAGKCGYNPINNTYLGYNAGLGNNDSTGGDGGSCNVAIGYHAASNIRSGHNNVLLGRYAGVSNSTGNNNFAAGNFALACNLTGSSIIAIGGEALGKTCTGSYNIALGCRSLYCTTTATFNIALGYYALYHNTTFGGSIAIGCKAGCCALCGPNIMIGEGTGMCLNGCHNTFLGTSAGTKATEATGNTFIGRLSGGCNTTGSKNVNVGWNAGLGNTTGSGNINVGRESGALSCGATGSANISMGQFSGKCISSAQCNISIGECAACCLSTGGCNVAIGKCAGKGYASGSENVSIGNESGSQSGNSSGSSNVTLGKAGSCITSGSCNIAIGGAANMSTGNVTGDANISMGPYTGRRLTSGGYNTFISGSAGRYTTTGSRNVFIGIFAGYCNVSGGCNVAIGCNAGRGSAAAFDNISMGRAALYSNEIGSGNVAIGHSAGHGIRGANNVSIGATAGPADSCTDTHDNVFIGSRTGTAYTGGCNIIAIGINAGASSCCAAFGCNNIHIGQNTGCKTQSGDNNITIGCRAGRNLTTGRCSIFIGLYAGGSISDTSSVLAIGNRAAQNAVGGVLAIGCCAAGQFGGGVGNGIFIGRCAGRYANASDSPNIVIGGNSGRSLTLGLNIIIGSSGAYHATSACRNIGLGGQVHQQLTTGDCNLALGTFANAGNTTGHNNIAIGDRSGAMNTGASGSCNVMISVGTGNSLTTGSDNIFVGRDAGYEVKSSSRNVIIGCGAGRCLRDGGGSNTFIGDQAGHYMGRCDCSTNVGNTFIGHSAGKHVVNSCHAVAIGYQAAHGIAGSKFFASHTINIGCRAGCKMEGGNSIINIGRMAGASNSGGSFNVNIGYTAGYNNLTGGNNFYGGYQAGFCNKTGGSNIAIGQNTFKCGTSGTTNIFMLNATGCNANGHSNIALGYIAFRCNSSGSHNLALGACAMRGCDTPANGTGCCNIFLGKASGCYISAGNKNTVIGVQAGYGITTGSCNVILGVDAGTNLTSNTHNVVIGPFANVPSGCSGTMTIGCCTMNWITGFNDGSVTINHGNANASGLLRISKNGNGAAELRLDTASSNTASVYLGDDEQLRIRYGSTEHTRFAANGNLGVGTASPRTKLHVEGSVHASRFFQNPTALDTSVTFPESGTAVNGGVYGPYTINSGVTLTISDGSTFTVV